MTRLPRIFPSIALIAGVLLVGTCAETNTDPTPDETGGLDTEDVSPPRDGTADTGTDRECWSHDDCPGALLCDPGAGHCTGCFTPEHCPQGAICIDLACALGGDCILQKDCAEGQICANGACAECKKDSQCPEGLQCVAHVCRGPAVPCTLASDCAPYGLLCDVDGFCVECQEHDDCDAALYCESGSCAPDACAPETAYCEAGHRVTCHASGSGLEATQCPGELRCEDGECL